MTPRSDMEVMAILDEGLTIDAAAAVVHGPGLSAFFWPHVREALGIPKDALEPLLEQVQADRETRDRHERIDGLARMLEQRVAAGDYSGALSLLQASYEELVGSASEGGEGLATLADETEQQREFLRMLAASEFLGLPQRRLPALDRLTRGLRGLMLFAGGPNVGKTVLAMQLALDALRADEDVCLVVVSLELTRRELECRAMADAGRLDWNELVCGSSPAQHKGGEPFRDKANRAGLDEAWRDRAGWARRTVVLDGDNCPEPYVETIQGAVRELRRVTGCQKAIVVVDYLQVMPIPERTAAQLRSELAEDKWRIAQLKRLRDSPEINAVIGITEARKPSGGSHEEWGGSLGDVSGSGRVTYSADIVMTLVPLSEMELAQLKPLKKRYPKVDPQADPSIPSALRSYRAALSRDGLSLVELRIGKVRDGGQKGEIPLTFHYRQTRFAEGLLS